MHTPCQELYILALLVMCVVKIRQCMAWGGSVQSASTMTSVPLATWVANTVWSMHLYDLTVWEIGMCMFFSFLVWLCILCCMSTIPFWGGPEQAYYVHTFFNVIEEFWTLTWSSFIKKIAIWLYPSLLAWAAVSNCHFSLSLTQHSDATEFLSYFLSPCVTSHYSLLTSTAGFFFSLSPQLRFQVLVTLDVLPSVLVFKHDIHEQHCICMRLIQAHPNHWY